MSYPSDLSVEQFNLIADLLPYKKTTRPKKYNNHQIFNAILYVLISGCRRFAQTLFCKQKGQWRMMPKDLPNWKTIHHYFLTWSKLEVFDQILKKSLKSGDYKKIEVNIQLYYSRTLKVPKTVIPAVED